VADLDLATLGEGIETEQNLLVESKARNETLLMAQVFLLQLLLQKIANLNTTLKCLFSIFKMFFVYFLGPVFENFLA
jgi:hypothetical protein